jgi:hypothetical protein
MDGLWIFSSIILSWLERPLRYGRGIKKKGRSYKISKCHFLVLIPKVNKSTSFGDFRPISLCNLYYKIIAKLLEKRLRPILSKGLAEEQLGFLQSRQILDTLGMVQECLHSIKKKNQQALILKIDLKKAYNLINWEFLRMILIKNGFGLSVTNWIMSCVTSVSYVVLINGEPSDFFQRGKGLR